MKKIIKIFTLALLLLITLSLTSCTSKRKQQSIYTDCKNHVVYEVCASDPNFYVEGVSCKGYELDGEICYQFTVMYHSSIYGERNMVVYALYDKNKNISCSYCKRDYSSETWEIEYNLRFAINGEPVECTEVEENDFNSFFDSLWGSLAGFLGLK